MILRTHRRNLVVWSSSVGSADWHGPWRVTRRARTRRGHRFIRTVSLLTLIGLMHVARAVRPRWRPLLAGGVLTVAGLILRNGAWGTVLLPGLLFLMSAPLVPGSSDADRKRLSELERELAVYSTPAQRCDLEATLDRYPDTVTRELRGILASQVMDASDKGIPGAGQH